jgi:L-ascorbate metabolism protein UlaG (beta-lactamase superfamily)
VNHSTFLIQVDGINILTDPVWSERVSPFTFTGPRRMRPPGVKFEELPRIDLVLLSHNHYDHLDVATLKRIHDKYNPQYIVPLGVSAYLRSKKIDLVRELDWWQKVSFGTNFNIEAVPAQHFSGRGTLDRDKTLWCGYAIHGDHGNIYFAGDTGYNPETFKEIGRRTNPTLAIIPIGAFKPEWFMSPIHCSPDEAVEIFKDLGSPQTIASHFGTFPLADDGVDDPIDGLKNALKLNGIPEDKFLVLKEGFAKDF